MTTLVEASTLIQSRFIDQWGTETEISFENKEIDIKALSEWVRLVVRNTDGGQESLGPTGARKFEYKALVIVQIFTVIGSGTKRANQLAQLVRDIFEGVQFDEVVVDAVLVDEVGVDDKWYQINVEGNVTYYHIK